MQPLDRLGTSAIKIGRSDYNLELEVGWKGEVGILSESLLGWRQYEQREHDLSAKKWRAEQIANFDTLIHISRRRFLEKSVKLWLGSVNHLR